MAAFMTVKLKHVESRHKIDAAILSFGSYEFEGQTVNGYELYCAGSGAHYVAKVMPFNSEVTHHFIQSLGQLESKGFREKIKIKCGWVNAVFRFSGLDEKRGVKVKSYLSGWLFFSMGIGSSYISVSELDTILSKLRGYTATS